MERIIKKFKDKSYLKYDQGKIDEWCVYYVDSDRSSHPPRDTEYFNQLRLLAKRYGVDRVYGDYVRVYDLTGKDVEEASLKKISEIANSYEDDALVVDVIFSILYMAMISEEKKKYTRLGKRIKRLGIHKLLKEESSVNEAANFMRDMKWPEIDKLCRERGF